MHRCNCRRCTSVLDVGDLCYRARQPDRRIGGAELCVGGGESGRRGESPLDYGSESAFRRSIRSSRGVKTALERPRTDTFTTFPWNLP